MDKVVDLNKTVYELCTNDPGIKDILATLGFTDILKPGMLNTAGRLMTIPKGAKMKKLDIGIIKEEFTKLGYSVTD